MAVSEPAMKKRELKVNSFLTTDNCIRAIFVASFFINLIKFQFYEEFIDERSPRGCCCSRLQDVRL